MKYWYQNWPLIFIWSNISPPLQKISSFMERATNLFQIKKIIFTPNPLSKFLLIILNTLTKMNISSLLFVLNKTKRKNDNRMYQKKLFILWLTLFIYHLEISTSIYNDKPNYNKSSSSSFWKEPFSILSNLLPKYNPLNLNNFGYGLSSPSILWE